MILGGPIEDLEGYYNQCIENIRKDKNYNSESKIFYKAHIRFLTHNKEDKMLFDKIASKNSLKYEELDIKKPVETIIDNFNISFIFSYYSSSLINLQLMNYSFFKINCFINSNHNINRELEDTFNYLDINIVRY